MSKGKLVISTPTTVSQDQYISQWCALDELHSGYARFSDLVITGIYIAMLMLKCPHLGWINTIHGS